MKKVCALTAAVFLSAAATECFAAGPAYGSPSLLPLPAHQSAYPTTAHHHTAYVPQPVHAWNANYQDQAAPAVPQPEPAEDAFADALSAPAEGYCNSCDACGDYGDSCGGGMFSGLFARMRGDGCGYGCGPTWFGYAGGLIMTRDRPDPVWITYPANQVTGALMSTRDALDDYQGGVEVRFGRRIGLNHALEFTYWTLDEAADTFQLDSPTNNLSSSLDFVNIMVGGQSINGIFTNSRSHRVTRHNEVHNIELNLLQMPLVVDPSAAFSFDWLFGVRFFRFDEGLLIEASTDDFGVTPLTEAKYDVDVENNLIGVQVGGNANWQIFDGLRFFCTPKVGLYGNDINHEQTIGLGNGLTGVRINSNKSDVSMMGQIDLGLDWQFTQNFSANIGYRALAISGIALADDQISAVHRGLQRDS